MSVFIAGCGLSFGQDSGSADNTPNALAVDTSQPSATDSNPTSPEEDPSEIPDAAAPTSTVSPGTSSSSSPPTTTAATTTTTTTTQLEPELLAIPEPVTEPPPGAGAYGEVVVRIESFWDESFPDFAGGGHFTPLDRDRIVGINDSDRSVPACDISDITARGVENNAFAAVCSEGQLIVWDNDDLFEQLLEDFGETGPAIVLAHELGHAAQFQAGTVRRSASVIVEQQADCLAGAYANWATERGIAPFDVPEALDAAVGATVSFRDQPGSSVNNANAHGSGFDRVRAFQDGFDRGVGFCAGYPDTPPPLTIIGFSPEEFRTGGNLPFEELIEIVTPYFNDFFAGQVDGWVDLAPTPDDLADLRREHLRVGDNSTGTRLAFQFAAAAQDILGVPTTGEGALLQQACLAGGLFEPLFFERQNSPDDLRLSAGDLDEAVVTLTRMVETSPELPAGFLFEFVAALRVGFTDGASVCNLT